MPATMQYIGEVRLDLWKVLEAETKAGCVTNKLIKILGSLSMYSVGSVSCR